MLLLPPNRSLALQLALTLALLGACEASPQGDAPLDGPPATSSGGTGGGLDVPNSGGAPGTGGSGGEVTSVTPDCARTEVTAVDTTITRPADILFVIDTSPSMLEEIGFVQQNLNAFTEGLVLDGVDARVIMIGETIPADVPVDMRHTVAGICLDPPLGSGSCPDDTLLPTYLHVDYAVHSADSLDILMVTKPDWIGQIRPEAHKAIVVISDDDGVYPRDIVFQEPDLLDDIDYMSEKFVEDFAASDPDLLSPWTLNGVFGFSVCEYSDDVGDLYARIVEMTNGVAGDLCEQDFEPVFDKLGTHIVEEAVTLSCEWELPDPVEGQTFSTELVLVTRLSGGSATQELVQVPSEAGCAAGGWHFDDPANPTRILACEETCDAIQDDAEGSIEVSFACELVEGCSASGAGTLGEGFEVEACAWPMPEPVEAGAAIDLDSLNVRYLTSSGFGVLLGRVDSAADCAAADHGWHYDSPETPLSIVACPDTCERLTSVDAQKVEALFGCETKQAVVR